jgi:transposase-like protein
MPAPHPQEFRDDVVAVARRGETSIKQVAKDFGISESCLRNWLRAADAAEGQRGGGRPESEELRELRRRNRQLEQENEVMRRAAASLSQANLRSGQFPQ